MQLWKLPEIMIAPEKIGSIFGFPITNTLLCTWIAIIILVVLFFFGTRNMKMVPSGLQNFLEWVIEFILRMVEDVSGKEKGRKFFPFVATFLIFILVANLLDVLPGIETIGTIKSAEAQQHAVWGFLLFGEHSNEIIPWFRPATTDLNLNLAMALVSVVATQVFGFIMRGTGEHLSVYFNFRALFTKGLLGLVDFFAGLLEIVSELGRLISFSFRLFGNIFAGSVLLAVFAFLVPALANVLFIPLELFVAAIQAYVFAFLTLLFMEVGTTSHEHAEHEYKEHEAEREAHEAAAAH